jgi:hypothetical protein
VRNNKTKEINDDGLQVKPSISIQINTIKPLMLVMHLVWKYWLNARLPLLRPLSLKNEVLLILCQQKELFKLAEPKHWSFLSSAI